MRPLQRRSELPLHHSRKGNGYVQNVGEKLNSALEKGLDMAGVKATKTGAGDKEKAYVVKSYTMLAFVLFCALISFSMMIGMIIFHMDLVVVERSRVHELSLNRVASHRANTKLMTAHVQLQKALDAEVHETIRLEEHRSALERNFGTLGNKIMKPLVVGEIITEGMRQDVEQALKNADDRSLKSINSVIIQFKKKSDLAKKELEHIAKTVIRDIELDEKERRVFEKRLKKYGKQKTIKLEDELTAEEKKDLGVSDSEDGFGEADEEDVFSVARDLEAFYEKLQALDFPLVDARIINAWEAYLKKVIETLDDAEKETDLAAVEKYLQEQVLAHIPKEKAFELDTDDSVIDLFEQLIYRAKIAPHKQDLLDMYSGWKSGNLTPFQVLANIESVAESEGLNLVYEWLNGFENEEK